MNVPYLTYCSVGLKTMNKHLAGSRLISCIECPTYRPDVQEVHTETDRGLDRPGDQLALQK